MLYTNHGHRSYYIQATARRENRLLTETSARRDGGVDYRDLVTTSSELVADLRLRQRGFWGRSNERRNDGRIYRLGSYLVLHRSIISLIVPNLDRWRIRRFR